MEGQIYFLLIFNFLEYIILRSLPNIQVDKVNKRLIYESGV